MNPFNQAVHKTPGQFFEGLGLTEMTSEEADRAAQESGGDTFTERLETARQWGRDGGEWGPFYELLHQDARVFAAMVAHNLPRLMCAAKLIAGVTPVPGMRVLDLGGGPGHLAFWTAEVWPQAQVTVVDPHGAALGEQLARQQRTDRVTFTPGSIDTLTPDQHGPFDFAIVSSMLALHGAAPAFADEAAFPADQTDDAPLTVWQRQGVAALQRFLTRITPVMDPESSLLLIEPWTPSSARLLAHALETTEWGFEVAHCAPSRGEQDQWVSLFMLTRGYREKREYARAAANAVALPDKLQILSSTAAESFRRAFQGETQGRLAVKYGDGHTLQVEVFEAEGLGGVYEQATNGYSKLQWGSLFHRPQYHSEIARYAEAAQAGEGTLLEASGPLFGV